MIKKILLIVISVMLVSPMFGYSVHAYDADGHNSLMCEMLFGNKNYADIVIDTTIQTKIKMLEYASFLCLDQYNGSGKNELEYLHKNGVKGIPKDISKINFNGNSTHRKHTHMGWNIGYSDEDKGHWNIRKEILLQTNNKVFGFNKHWEWSSFSFVYDEKCESFSRLMYLIHVFGDILDQKKVDTNTLQFVVQSPSQNNPDIFYEFDGVFEILFSDLNGTWVYRGFKNQFNKIASDARTVLLNNEKSDDDKFTELKNYEYDLEELLIQYIPSMLKSEDFFSAVFYE